MTVRVHKLATTPPYTNLVLQLALTESEIMVNWQGQTHLNLSAVLCLLIIMVLLLISVHLMSRILILHFTMGADWVSDNCELVAFIQNNDGKEILQGTKLDLTSSGSITS